MRQLWMIMLMVSLAALPACAARQSQVDTSAPTVSYEFDDGDDYDDVVQKAELYCEEQYDRDAVLVDRDMDDDDLDDDDLADLDDDDLDDLDDTSFEATFACK